MPAKNLILQQLVQKIQKHNAQYRNGTPTITDAEYDAEIEELKNLDPDNDWFKRIEPVQVDSKRKVKLPIPMKSLNKAKSLAEVLSWVKSLALTPSTTIVINPKFDGLSLLHDEITNRAYSRGGAENEGQDCTSHYKKLNTTAPDKITSLFTYGELVFNRKSWRENFEDKISPETGDKYRSPRNTAAGLLNRTEASDLLQYLDFYRYGVDELAIREHSTYSEILDILHRQFKQPNLYWKGVIDDLTDELLMSLFKEWSQLYYIDGLVIYINDLRMWERIGRQQTTGNPIYAIAYKHPDFTASFETTIKGITWNVSKAGALKPVVNIEEVDTGDCIMENPTGYNAAWIEEHQIAKGAKILVTRSGGVIPKILETLVPPTQEEILNQRENLKHCPVCGAETKWDGPELYCANPNCNGIKLSKINFFFTTVGVENMGEEIYKKLYNSGLTSIKAILNVTAKQLFQIDGIGDGIAATILDNMRKIKNGVELTTLMHSSDCFKGIGKIKAQKILSKMDGDDITAFINGTLTVNDNLANYAGMSITQQAFYQGAYPFYLFVRENEIPILLPSEQKATSNKYINYNVCFSGIRDEALEKKIIAGGGKIANGVTKNTTHLIVKDENSTSLKIAKAKLLKIPIINIKIFSSTIS